MIYFDNAATTAVKKEVLEKMLPYFSENYGNASSIYTIGRTSAAAISKAREQVANAIGCKSNEVYFTGCGSEADNWAIRGACMRLRSRGRTHLFLHQCILT